MIITIIAQLLIKSKENGAKRKLCPLKILELGSDGFVVVGVGAGGFLAQDLGLGDLGHKHHAAVE